MSFADGWMAQMRKDSWDDSLPLNIITYLLRSFRCYAYSLRRSTALVNPASSRAHRHTCTCRSGLAIFLLDEDSQGKSIGPWWWFATQTLGSEWKAWSMSLWELIQIFQQLNLNLFLSLRKDGATVICSCVDRYHSIPYSWSAAKENAG